MNEVEHRSILSALRNNLKIILDTDLGKYEIVNPNGQKINEVDAIWVEPPELPSNYRVKANSGIEVIISREPNLIYERMAYEVGVYGYCITLKQYDLSRSLIPAVDRLADSPYWNLQEQPKMFSYLKTAEGIVRPRAVIKVTVARLLG